MGKGRAPCCDKDKVKRGPWSPQEDFRLITFINKHGHENWRALPKQAGLLRCGKSCRLRWINYLRPDVKRGNFTKEEEDTIIRLQETLGNKWSKIASHLTGRTDNEIKNVWNTHLKKRFASKNVKDESKESCMASSSCSFITFGSSSCDQRNIEVELEQRGHEGSATKLPGEDSSISSSITNSSQVDVPNPEEVNKPEISDTDIDIPWESDSDFWDMLNSLGSLQPDDQIQSNEVENDKWLEYLEIELGLEVTRNVNQNNLSNNVVEPLVPEMYDMLLSP